MGGGRGGRGSEDADKEQHDCVNNTVPGCVGLYHMALFLEKAL